MFVRKYMSPDPVTISPDENFYQAMDIMRKNKIRRLPVVEARHLVGVIVEKDLISTQPSTANSLSLYEVYSLLETIRVRQIMSRPVLTVEGDCPLEEAARIMIENTIGCLPVMVANNLVGIITETDVFKALVEVLGGKQQGYRFTVIVQERVGQLARITERIASAGGNISAVTTSEVIEGARREVTIKTTGADPERLKELIGEAGFEIVDARPSARYEPRLFS
jgi:acetoin utilization protein AcuB